MAELSIHEQKLEEIALAIQEKEGSSAPIAADDFAARIRAIKTDNLPTNVHRIQVSTNDSSLGTVTGGGYASAGMIATLTAKPITKATFEGWKENGTIATDRTPLVFTVENDRSLIAMFKEVKFTNTWYEAAMPESTKSWGRAVYADGKFFAITPSWVNKYTASSTNGLNWILLDTPVYSGSLTLGKLVYGNGVYVATMSTSSPRGVYSKDGTNWTTMNFHSYAYIVSVAYGNGLFVAVADGSANVSTQAAYSKNGSSWSSSALPKDGTRWNDVAYGDGKFVAVSTGKNAAYTIDGKNWEILANMPASGWTNIAYGNGRFVATFSNGTIFRSAYSLDGINWTGSQELSTTGRFYYITYGEDKFVVLDSTSNSNNAMYSTDGINWVPSTLPSTANWNGLVYGDGKFIAFDSNSNKIAYLV